VLYLIEMCWENEVENYEYTRSELIDIDFETDASCAKLIMSAVYCTRSINKHVLTSIYDHTELLCDW
jgi:hypothetical protein